MNDITAHAHADVNVLRLEVEGAAGRLEARHYQARPSALSSQLVVFFHGGGFSEDGLAESDQFLRALTSSHRQLSVLSSSYRLAHAAPFPAAAEDAYSVVAWAARNPAALNWDGGQLLVAGIESGANLAAVASVMARDRGKPSLAGQILIMPMLDPSLSSASMRSSSFTGSQERAAAHCADSYRAYLPYAADRCHPYASPLQSSRLGNLAPALILAGDDDPLRDEAELYAARLIAQGVKTSVMRIRNGPLDHHGARTACASSLRTIHEIGAFLAALTS